MRIATVFFALGTLWLQLQPALLPLFSLHILLPLIAGAVILPVATHIRPRTLSAFWTNTCQALGIALLAFALGSGWANLRAQARIADSLPESSEGQDIEIIGTITDLPQRIPEGVRFHFEVQSASAPVPRHIQLSWYRDNKQPLPVEFDTLEAGERWRFQVRLKKPHGFANPNGFDYEAWLLERNIRATGYIRTAPAAERLDIHTGGLMAAVHRLRGSLRTRFLNALPEAPYAGMLIALAIGDQRAIPEAQWETFRRTGITHLVAISGMHITLIAALAGGLVAGLWRKSPRLIQAFPVRKAGAVAALCAAMIYALLSGLGIPAQRALIMLTLAAVALLLGRQVAPSRILALALIGVLIIDPWAVLAAGFWLSFCAVGIILLVVNHVPATTPNWKIALRLQLAITFGMIPLLLILFQSFSLISPLANVVAIPVVNFLITPLTLAATILPAEPLLWLAHFITEQLMRHIEWLSAWPVALWQQGALPPLLALGAIFAVLILLLPAGTPGKLAALVVVLAVLGWQPPRPEPGELHATVLDVGNGLAVHLQTATHDLLYDTGPPYGTHADAGSRVVLPYLAARGVSRLDRLVLSHDDSDHTGGTRSLLAALPVESVYGPAERSEMGTDTPLFSPVPLPCRTGEKWRWDQVDFEILHPSADMPSAPKRKKRKSKTTSVSGTLEDAQPEQVGNTAPAAPVRRGNNDSCVLKVSAGGKTFLLLGDIEARAEKYLIQRNPDALRSDVVVVAHHGGRSSSSSAFIDAAQARHALFSVGYRNRFHHPHPDVRARWEASGAQNWRTDTQGAIQMRMTADALTLNDTRSENPRYWHRQ